MAQPTFTENPNDRQEKIKREILAYCVAHPDAKDALGGILKWWLAPRRNQWRIEEVRTALENLTAKAWLTSRMMRQAEQIYSLNKEKIQEIETFLGNSWSTFEPK